MFIRIISLFMQLCCIHSICYNQNNSNNNNALQLCLSSALPSSIRVIYPCCYYNTTITITSSRTINVQQQYCQEFNFRKLSYVRGGRINHAPAALIYVTDSDDIQQVMKCALKLNYVVNALGGGHSFEGYGLGTLDNNIILIMEQINYIRVNQYDGIATVGAGARLGPIFREIYKQGENRWTISAGSCPWVGIAGHTLGGGYGILSRQHGLVSDTVLEMEAVNSQGELLTINEKSEPDLYWALRGGGGGLFVIVTEFKIKLFKPPQAIYSATYAWDVPPLLNVSQIILKQHQHLIFDPIFTRNKNLTLTMEITNNKTTLGFLSFDGTSELENEMNEKIFSSLPTPTRMDERKEDWSTLMHRFTQMSDEYLTLNFKAKNLYFNAPMSNNTIERLLYQTQQIPVPYGNVNNYLIFNQFGGQINSVSSNDTANPHRNMTYYIQFSAAWNDEEETSSREHMDWLNAIYESVYEDSTKYSYINKLDRDIPDDVWMDVYYAQHKQRLIHIKQKYDSENRFNFERTIPLVAYSGSHSLDSLKEKILCLFVCFSVRTAINKI